MSSVKQYTIAGLSLSLYIGDKKDVNIHLICNDYNTLAGHSKKALEEVAGLVTDALQTSTHAEITSLESIDRDISRFDISATKRDVSPNVLFDAADYALEKLLPKRIARAKYQISAISNIRESVRNHDRHELNTLRTALRGKINHVFAAFRSAATEKPASSIARRLSDNLRDKLIHRVMLDYLMGDEIMSALLEPTVSRKLGEKVDTFIERTSAATDRSLQRKIEIFLEEQHIGNKTKSLRKYLAGELATAIESAIAIVQPSEIRRAKSH